MKPLLRLCLLPAVLLAGSALAAPSAADLRQQAARCDRLLRSSVVDFYLPACVDRTNGGYLENLDADGKFTATGEKFLTLQARQLWFFSTLAVEGVRREEALAAARAGYDFLQAKFFDEANGAYFSKTSDRGAPTDTRKHLYLNSFALYGLVACHRASGDRAALDAARRLFTVLDDKAHDAVNGGYHEFFHADWKPVTDPAARGYVGAIGTKTYNTHLHLLESFTELHRVWPDPRVTARLNELLHLNTSTFRHPDHACNVDAWQPDWRMILSPQNLRASYGHDVECAWLALDAARALGRPAPVLRNWAVALGDYSLRHGYDPEHGGFYYTGPLDAPADNRMKEWWVQAEALVGMLELHRLTGEARFYDAFARTLDFIERHQIAREGGWWATRQADGSPASNKTRSSMWQGAYHNGRALLLSRKLLDDLAARAEAGSK